MDDLIAKLEAAEEGSDMLDLEIARGIGWREVYHGDESRGYFVPRFVTWENPEGKDLAAGHLPPCYSRSLDAALSLVPENISWELIYSAAGEGAMCRCRTWDWRRGPRMIDPDNEQSAEAATPALALCIAALKARAANA